MRVRFVGSMPTTGYSGGRLLALTMAESLAFTGTEVDFVVDNVPEMYEEFRSFSRIQMVQADFRNLSPCVDRSIDIVVIVPEQSAIAQHGEWTRHAIECRAKVVLLNFESPNWFNSVSPYKRSAELWKGWDIVSEHANLILSISGEGNKYARVYYNNCSKGCLFDFSYPGINTVLADKAPTSAQREKQVVLLTRVDAHKGFDALQPLVHRDLAGYRVVVYLGNGRMSQPEINKWSGRFDRAGMDFMVQPAIKGIDKFTMLKRSSLLYFPTRFEGFGIPPLESAYCLLPCVCSDLPVLREYGQDAFVYGNLENSGEMHRAVLRALESQNRLVRERERIRIIARMEEWGNRLAAIFGRIS